MNTLGENIKRAREKAGIGQRKLAELLGVKTHTVWRWEKGERNPSWTVLRSIAIHLNVPLTELVGDAEEAVPRETGNEPGAYGLAPETLEFWRSQAKIIERLLNTESQDAFAQVEDIYIEKFNAVKQELYRQSEWVNPKGTVYVSPYPEKLGGLLERVHTFYGTLPCRSLSEEDRMGYRIKLWRQLKGMSIEELAEKAGVAPETVWRWENLREAKSAPDDRKVLEALRIGYWELLDPSSTSSERVGVEIASFSGETDDPVRSAPAEQPEELEEQPQIRTEDKGVLVYEANGQKIQVPATPEYAAQFWARVDKMMGREE